MTVTYTRNANFARGETATLGPWPLANTGISAADVTAGAVATIRIGRLVDGVLETDLELNSDGAQVTISATAVSVELVPASTGALTVTGTSTTYRGEVSVAVPGGETRVIGDGAFKVREQLPETDIPAPDPDDSLIRVVDVLHLQTIDLSARTAPVSGAFLAFDSGLGAIAQMDTSGDITEIGSGGGGGGGAPGGSTTRLP
jgi:hypothetical protein